MNLHIKFIKRDLQECSKQMFKNVQMSKAVFTMNQTLENFTFSIPTEKSHWVCIVGAQSSYFWCFFVPFCRSTFPFGIKFIFPEELHLTYIVVWICKTWILFTLCTSENVCSTFTFWKTFPQYSVLDFFFRNFKDAILQPLFALFPVICMLKLYAVFYR